MRILKHSEIDKRKWDAMILRSEFPLVFAQSFYLDATSPHWNAIVDGDYESGMPLTWKRKMGISYLIQPPFTPQLGVFGKHSSETDSETLQLAEVSFKFIDIELNASVSVFADHSREKRTFVIDLRNDFSYNTNTKRNIQKALKCDFSVLRAGAGEAAKLSKKFLHPFLKNKLKLKNSDVKIFQGLLQKAYDADYAETFLVKNGKGEPAALGHFISNGKHAVYLKGTNLNKSTGSMHLLMNEAIEFYRKSGVHLFDFGGGQLASMAQFYSGFGATELIYKTYKINHLPKVVRWIKK